MAIKELLKEELGNSLRMERDYAKALAQLPRGCLVKKLIRGRPYYYLASRDGRKVRFKYLGKNVSKEDVARNQKARKRRVQYRKLLSEVRGQIKFIRKALRAKQ